MKCVECGDPASPFFGSSSSYGWFSIPLCSFTCGAIHGRQTSVVITGFTVVIALLAPVLFLIAIPLGFYSYYGFQVHNTRQNRRARYRQLKQQRSDRSVIQRMNTPPPRQTRAKATLANPGARYRTVEYQAERSDKTNTSTKRETVFVKSLGKEFDICCYQSARLQDKYCMCGKAVDQELMKTLSA